MPRIIIILEHHIDAVSTAAIIELAKFLHANGYHSLLMEYPGDGAGIEAALEHTLKIMKEEALRPALHYLITGAKVPRNATGVAVIDGQPVNAELLINMDFERLCKVLQEYVSSTHYADMAKMIQEIKPTASKLALIKSFRAAGHKVIGADLELSQAERARAGADPALFARRDAHMCDVIQARLRAGEDCVFIVGKSHAPGLVPELARRGLLAQATFIDPCSSKTEMVERMVPEYSAFVRRYADIIHRLMINPAIGIAEHLPKIAKLLGISSAPSSTARSSPTPRS